MASVYVDLAGARLRAQVASPRLFALRCVGDAFLIIAEALGPLFLVSRFGSTITTTTPVAGTYTIVVDPMNQYTGSMTLALVGV